YAPRKCYECESTGHIARNCPKRKDSSRRDARSFNQISVKDECYETDGDTEADDYPISESKQDDAETTEYEEDPRDDDDVQDDEHHLRFLDFNVNHIVALPSDMLGPVLRLPVEIGNVLFADAIVDSGCPTNIISGAAAKKIAATKRTADSEFWNRSVRFEEGVAPFRDYSGKRLQI
ncbi:MAG: hypothetical protein GY737_17185, partial [Desulfobacteraceae bacterium]|nr:hypothetical protein [Desulfobacteraceae bacterium]